MFPWNWCAPAGKIDNMHWHTKQVPLYQCSMFALWLAPVHCSLAPVHWQNFTLSIQRESPLLLGTFLLMRKGKEEQSAREQWIYLIFRSFNAEFLNSSDFQVLHLLWDLTFLSLLLITKKNRTRAACMRCDNPNRCTIRPKHTNWVLVLEFLLLLQSEAWWIIRGRLGFNPRSDHLS